MREKLKEAVDLFVEVMIYGTEQVTKRMEIDIWKEYSPEQIQVLKILSDLGPLSNGKLAEYQNVHKSAISSRLKKLEEKGLIRTSRDETDHRAKVVQLTKAGAEVLRTSNEAVNDSIEKILGGHINEEEIDTFLKTFRKLKTILLIKESNE